MQAQPEAPPVIRGSFGAIIPWIPRIILLVAALYSIALVTALIDWGFLKNEISAYAIDCENQPIAGNCAKPKYALRKTTYKISQERQEVLYWVEGFEVERLSKCAIRDRKNWNCRHNDESAEFGFTSGKFWEGNTPEAGSNEYYVSRTKWLSQRCKDSWIPYLICLPLIGHLE